MKAFTHEEDRAMLKGLLAAITRGQNNPENQGAALQLIARGYLVRDARGDLRLTEVGKWVLRGRR